MHAPIRRELKTGGTSRHRGTLRAREHERGQREPRVSSSSSSIAKLALYLASQQQQQQGLTIPKHLFSPRKEMLSEKGDAFRNEATLHALFWRQALVEQALVLAECGPWRVCSEWEWWCGCMGCGRCMNVQGAEARWRGSRARESGKHRKDSGAPCRPKPAAARCLPVGGSQSPVGSWLSAAARRRFVHKMKCFTDQSCVELP